MKLPWRKKQKGRGYSLSERLADRFSVRRIKTAIERIERRAGITRLGVVGIVLAVVMWGFARLIAGKTLYLFAYGTLVMMIVTWATVRRHLPLEGARSDMRARAREGEILGVELSLTARRRLSTIVLEEDLPDRLGTPVRLPIATLAGGQEVHHSYRLQCRRRGAYKLGPLVVRWGDPIGLVQRQQTLADAFELLIHPSVEPVLSRPLTRQFEDPPIRPPVSKPWPSGLEFYGMRDYQPGDDLRRIVWKAMARTGRVLVREAEQGITDQISIVLDNDMRHHSREDPSDSFETGVRIAASLGVKHLTEGYAVTTNVNEGPITKSLRAQGAPIRLLDALARVELGKTPLDKLIMRLVATPGRDAHNILITPRLGADVAAHLRMLLNKGVSILVVALIWDEEAAETLNTATALGCQVVEMRPGQSIQAALSLEVGKTGRR